MLKGVSQINQSVIADLVKRHHGSGLAAVDRATAGLPRGTYAGRVVEAKPQLDQWDRRSTRAVLEVTEGPHAGRQISVDVLGMAARLLENAAVSRGLVRFEVFVRRREDGRPFSLVNRETIRCAAGSSSDIEAKQTPGLPAHVLAMLAASGDARGCDGESHHVMNPAVDPMAGKAPPPSSVAILMLTGEYTHGFTCVGSKNAMRKISSWSEKYAAMAGCTDPTLLGRPVFLSMYKFTDGLVSYMRNHEKPGSMAGYRGVVYSPLLVFDIDCKDPAGRPEPSRALQDACKLLIVLLELGIPADSIQVSFSGSKGFHVDFPSMLAGAAPAADFPATEKAFCSMIAAEAGIQIDTSLYNALHTLRAPNSRHEASGLYKVSMSAAESLDLSLAQIQALAAKPRAFTPPKFIHEPIPALWELWRHARDEARNSHQCHESPRGATAGDARIWQSTWQFLVSGAPDGERAVATFRAAANLAHFETVDDLIRALLDRGVTLSGLPRTEAAGHIESALRRAGEAQLLDQIEFPVEP